MADNFQVITCDDLQYVAQALVSANGITLNNIKHNKFVTATNDDSTELNRILSGLINPHGTQFRKISCYTNRKDPDGNKIKVQLKYSIGDPVIFTKNEVYPGVSNGCEGIISGFITDIYQYMIVTIDPKNPDSNIRVPLYLVRGTTDEYTARHIFLAYAITVYKAQGSEWPYVYFYANGSADKKRLSYTAITRAKNGCCVIEVRQDLYRDVCRTPINVHYGALQERIKMDDNLNRNVDNISQLDAVAAMMSHVNLTGNLIFN